MAYARTITATWANSGMPDIATATPASAVGGAERKPGLAFDPVNGFSEGYNIYPTIEDGDTITRWARETVAAHRAHWTAPATPMSKLTDRLDRPGLSRAAGAEHP